MPLVSASILPHSPFLISEIGKENFDKLKNTFNAIEKIREDIESKDVDTLIVISPHGPIQENTFSFNLSPEFESNFEEFGNFSVRDTYLGDIGLTHKIREKLETNTQLQLITETKIDHGVSIPLHLLTKNLKDIRIIPIYYSGLSQEDHFKFGEKIKQELFHTEKNVAIIASGDLSHRLSKTSPAGYSPKGKKFDKKIISLLQKDAINDIINIDFEITLDAQECALRSILILLGIIDKIKHKPKLLSYEAPFGIGYMVMNFEL